MGGPRITLGAACANLPRGLLLLVLAALAGCTRAHYRDRADCESYAIIAQRVGPSNWTEPGFSIDHDPRSRLFQASDPDAPLLPEARAALYQYDVPPLRSDLRPAPYHTAQGPAQPALKAQAAPDQKPAPSAASGRAPHGASARSKVVRAAYQQADPASRDGEALREEEARERARQQILSEVEELISPEPTAAGGRLESQRTPLERWNDLPEENLARMLEFPRLREEYERSLQGPIDPAVLSTGRVLTLENIVELGLLNSREFQTQKETLYRAALVVSLARFDFALKFSPFDNGAALLYDNVQSGVHQTSTLAVPSSARVDQALATAGTLVGRFANQVLLTFGGPEGFSADVSSLLLLDLTQPLLQRDVRLEPLTRAERNLLYAARTYARFRKTFFVQLASDYYNLLRSYRQIEIEAQNYFSLSRAHDQARIELEAGLRSRIQAEQIEQSMLAGRSRLIAACVALDRNLDRLKITLGLPPELPLRLDLAELEFLTARDQVAVAAESVRRTRQRLVDERAKPAPQAGELVNAAIIFRRRLVEWQRSMPESSDPRADQELSALGLRLSLADARLVALRQWQALDEVAQSPQPPAVRLFQRRVELAESLLAVAHAQFKLAVSVAGEPADAEEFTQRAQRLAARAGELRDRLTFLLESAALTELAPLADQARDLLLEAERHARAADALEGAEPEPLNNEARVASILEIVEQLVANADVWLARGETGLARVSMAHDDALLTSLALRLDLMNERGALADARRLIKLAADDLRSVLNLRATEIVETQLDRPFGFTFDESRTHLGATLDLPLNRKAQRNEYRRALINFRASHRNLMQKEDAIKQAVRDDLRNLALARALYQIGVASAALANERVTSTRVELALGFPGVAARDFLEAQDAYRLAVSGVADNRLGYIINRMQFFVDLELIELDADGFWQGLRDESYGPQPVSQIPGEPYGPLVPGLWYSREIRALHGR